MFQAVEMSIRRQLNNTSLNVCAHTYTHMKKPRVECRRNLHLPLGMRRQTRIGSGELAKGDLLYDLRLNRARGGFLRMSVKRDEFHHVTTDTNKVRRFGKALILFLPEGEEQD